MNWSNILGDVFDCVLSGCGRVKHGGDHNQLLVLLFEQLGGWWQQSLRWRSWG